MSQTLRQFEAMIEEQTRGMDPHEAAQRRKTLLDNPVLQQYYSQEGKLFVTVGDKVVDTLDCQRVMLAYPCQDPDDASHWQASPRGQVNLARTRNGNIWAFMDTGPIFHSDDDGKSWRWTPGSSHTSSKDFTFTILEDDTFLVVGQTEEARTLLVHKSRDLGESWEHVATISPPAPYVTMQDDTPAMTQLADGTILFTAQCATKADWSQGRGALVCHSQDAGKSWSVHNVTWDATRLTPDGPEFPPYGPQYAEAGMICGESHILELPSGSLLHTMRVQRLPKSWEHLSKTVFFTDSDDGGLTWKNIRPTLDADGKPVLVCGQCHSWSGRLPDGRIVMAHDHRYPYSQGQTIAHVSNDGARTWDQRAYHLVFGAGYPATLILDDGTILTVSGAGLSDDKAKSLASRGLWTSVAVRWKLRPQATR